MRHSLICKFFLFLAVCLCYTVFPAQADEGSEKRISIFDSHSHYKQADAEKIAPAKIVELMQASQVEKMLIIGEPASRALALYAFSPNLFVPFLGLYDDKTGKSNWMHDETLPVRLEKALQQTESPNVYGGGRRDSPVQGTS